MIILDASVLIAHFEPNDRHHDAADALLRTATDEQLAASVVTLAEFYVAPARDAGLLRRAVADVARLDVQAVPLPLDAAIDLALIRVESGSKMPDCCVLLAAQQTSSAVATFDDRLRRAARHTGLVVLPVQDGD